MEGFGDFANIDVDKLIGGAQQRMARMQEMQARLADVVGRAEAEQGRIKAAFTATGGLTELEIDPRALRMPAKELAETIRTTVQEAAQDLQRRISALMGEVFGDDENPMKLLENPDAAIDKAKEAQAAYDRTMKDVMGELDAIRRRLDL